MSWVSCDKGARIKRELLARHAEVVSRLSARHDARRTAPRSSAATPSACCGCSRAMPDISPLPELRFAEIPAASRPRYAGDRFSYLEAGRPDLPPIVLLHGIGANSMHWRYQLAGLAWRFRAGAGQRVHPTASVRGLAGLNGREDWPLYSHPALHIVVLRQEQAIRGGAPTSTCSSMHDGHSSLSRTPAKPPPPRA
jgi:hypothetical protein